MAVLLAWTKIVLAEELLAGELPDDPYLDLDLKAYFPTPMREQFRAQIEAHPLRREIIVTQVVNRATTTLTLSSQPDPSTFGQQRRGAGHDPVDTVKSEPGLAAKHQRVAGP